MKYLKSINESKIDYVKLLTEIYHKSFKLVFEQNKELKNQLEDIEDIFMEVFDYFGEYPKVEHALYFFDKDSDSLDKFKLRIDQKDLMNDYDDDDYYNDYKYFSKILSKENMEVYFLVFYYFEGIFPKNLIIDKEKITKRLSHVDFSPVYFTKTFGDPSHNKALGAYKKVNLKYEFDLDYLLDFPQSIRKDIHLFKSNNNLSKKGLNQLLKIINKIK
jgi:hypothetical protein